MKRLELVCLNMAMNNSEPNKADTRTKKVLIVPAVKPEQGTGHLKRSINLFNKLGDIAYMYIPGDILSYSCNRRSFFRPGSMQATDRPICP